MTCFAFHSGESHGHSTNPYPIVAFKRQYSRGGWLQYLYYIYIYSRKKAKNVLIIRSYYDNDIIPKWEVIHPIAFSCCSPLLCLLGKPTPPRFESSLSPRTTFLNRSSTLAKSVTVSEELDHGWRTELALLVQRPSFEVGVTVVGLGCVFLPPKHPQGWIYLNGKFKALFLVGPFKKPNLSHNHGFSVENGCISNFCVSFHLG